MTRLEQPEGRAVPAGRPTSDPVSSWRARWCSRRRWSSVVALRPSRRCSSSLSVLVAWHRWILTWHVLLCFVIGSRAVRPGRAVLVAINLPFGLELYRIAVALVLLVWVASLLVDPRVRLRRTPLDAPVALIVAASLGSVAVNFGRVAPLASAVLKGVTLFLSFVILFYFISSVVTSAAGVVVVTKFIVSGVACRRVLRDHRAADRVQRLRSCSKRPSVPAIRRVDRPAIRYGLIRAVGSADHPIALGVLFAMVFPLGLALARSRSRVWWAPTLDDLIGVIATASRTPIMALVTAGVALLWLRPRDILPSLATGDPDGDRHQDRRSGIDRDREELFLPRQGGLDRVTAHARG